MAAESPRPRNWPHSFSRNPASACSTSARGSAGRRGGLPRNSTTGVDLTPEFCAAAKALNAATGLADRVAILKGSALALPVPNAAFDAAYSQNVIMNIADKKLFYREASPPLRPGGGLALSSVGAGPSGEPYFPVPGATARDTSFLATPEEMRWI